MTVTGKVLKWGNSYGIRLDKKTLKEFDLVEGMNVRCDIKREPAAFEELRELFAQAKNYPVKPNEIKTLQKELRGKHEIH